MNIHLSPTPLISLIAGVLILIMPKLLRFIVAVYLILIGLIGVSLAIALRRLDVPPRKRYVWEGEGDESDEGNWRPRPGSDEPDRI